MRYQRLSYRYSVSFEPTAMRRQPDPWRAGQLRMAVARARWSPAADVYETPESVVITVELAGVDQEELDVLLFEDALVVEGQRRLPRAEPGSVYYAAEIRQGPFRLEIMLPKPADLDGVDAVYDRGLLRINLPKQNEG
jgi:HSP20 family molecular chaperone IbpA